MKEEKEKKKKKRLSQRQDKRLTRAVYRVQISPVAKIDTSIDSLVTATNRIFNLLSNFFPNVLPVPLPVHGTRCQNQLGLRVYTYLTLRTKCRFCLGRYRYVVTPSFTIIELNKWQVRINSV